MKKHSAEDIVNCMLSFPKGTKYTVLAPLLPREGRSIAEQLDIDLKQGFTRVEVNREVMRIEDFLQQVPAEGKQQNIYLLIDRMTADDSKDSISRLTDSAETAMYEGDGACMLRFYSSDGSTQLFPSARSLKQTVLPLRNPTTKCFLSTPHWCLPQLRRFRQGNRNR